MTLWSRGFARASLVGAERTHNPSPAAASLLRGRLGKRGVRRALARAGKLRRSSHRGNPLPAVVGLLGGLGGLGGRFKKPSEKRAAGAASTLVAAAVAGNLTAAKAIAERTEIGIQKERAVWRKAATQVPANIWALVTKYQELIPGVDHTGPESAAETALARAISGPDLEEKAAARVVARRAVGTAAERRAEAKQAVREAQLAGVATAVGKGLLSRGRSLRRAPRRRSRF